MPNAVGVRVHRRYGEIFVIHVGPAIARRSGSWRFDNSHRLSVCRTIKSAKGEVTRWRRRLGIDRVVGDDPGRRIIRGARRGHLVGPQGEHRGTDA